VSAGVVGADIPAGRAAAQRSLARILPGRDGDAEQPMDTLRIDAPARICSMNRAARKAGMSSRREALMIMGLIQAFAPAGSVGSGRDS
jgi:hypothetical protein